ncbi:methyltransferase domain-containing protein [Acetobacterium tundrae]|uniref:Methyltransferase domain-containing protein n=1 Tax=Acetobacterium tundrae TaxID=132932 RepID=A0ABR6WIH9_9FIRM|nr:methyltransferase domain-containing protein [Acetobacterium tundrae]MBC3796252.1 methyltransferase domain-containing protein [Acetobacterium tundrae]
MEDWNVKLYSQFEKERAQPSIDLVNRIGEGSFKRIIDIGCGSGMSTIPLRNRFIQAEIVGADASTSMLNKARETMDDVTWIQRDCSRPLTDLGKFDLVFSNAALQWFENQGNVIKNLSDILLPEGLLAIQIPYFSAMTIKNCIAETVKTYDADTFIGIEKELFKSYPPEFYYDELTKHFSKIELWQTNYFHIMNKHEEILEFCKSTGLRPYAERFEGPEKIMFFQRVLNEIKKQYPAQENGKVLFEFKRIFFMAKK